MESSANSTYYRNDRANKTKKKTKLRERKQDIESLNSLLQRQLDHCSHIVPFLPKNNNKIQLETQRKVILGRIKECQIIHQPLARYAFAEWILTRLRPPLFHPRKC